MADRNDVSLFARAWVVASPLLERVGLADSRRRLVADLHGTVVEVGAGSGVTFEHYPPEVTRVVAVEPDPHLRAHALRYAAGAPVRVEVVDTVAEALPLADGEADAVVFGLVLCTVPDVAAALAEARRVLAPDGELRLLEHVRADGALGRVADRIAPVWSRVGGGCRPNRDTARRLDEAGFDVSGLRTSPFPPVFPLTPMLTGSARPRSPGRSPGPQ
ncbi:class I SAM-dependent methyltransferase [Dietzia sp. UBA5065]|uniref:class I SAM-dependent methyltransferase n=1 Tax=Dietzia sp. UBA5065 TaxID=1946422 RepID=UPI0025BFC46C|nr:class I SAM-dependent methyltransferase [Dietzia sp. UBA5065]